MVSEIHQQGQTWCKTKFIIVGKESQTGCDLMILKCHLYGFFYFYFFYFAYSAAAALSFLLGLCELLKENIHSF